MECASSLDRLLLHLALLNWEPAALSLLQIHIAWSPKATHLNNHTICRENNQVNISQASDFRFSTQSWKGDFKFYKVRSQQFVSWLHNIQMLLEWWEIRIISPWLYSCTVTRDGFQCTPFSFLFCPTVTGTLHCCPLICASPSTPVYTDIINKDQLLMHDQVKQKLTTTDYCILCKNFTPPLSLSFSSAWRKLSSQCMYFIWIDSQAKTYSSFTFGGLPMDAEVLEHTVHE